jgi:hypothetical protein
MTPEQEELFRKDPIISLALEQNVININLVGGAVIDILEGRKVKDYDFFNLTSVGAEKLGFKYSHDSKTATTYIKDNFTIQVLKVDINDFDFKISMAKLSWNYQKKLSLDLDETSFNNKTLIPPQKAWTEKKNALNSLRRIPHWQNKGYEINDVTYLSLLSVVGKGNNYNS